MNNSRYIEDDFPMFVSQLIETSRITGDEAGIARYFLDHGYEALSVKQKYVFDKAIEENYVSECSRCCIEIPWCEMLEALDNGGYCNYCQYMMEKEEEEDASFEIHTITGSTINKVNNMCVNTVLQKPQPSDDSSINVSFTLFGVSQNHKFTEEQIETAFQESIDKE